MSARRIDTSGNESEDGERVSVRIHYSTSNIDNQNGEHENPRTYKLQYRRSDETEFTTFESGEASLIHFQTHAYKSAPIISSDYSYVIRLEVADFFKTTVCDVEIPTAYTLMDFNSSGKGVAFGKVSEKDGVEVNMDTDFLKGVNVYSINFRKKDGTLTSKVTSSGNGDGLNIIIYGSDGATKELTVFKDGGITLPIEETFFTAETDVTINRSTVSRQGNIVLFYAYVTASNAIGSGNVKRVGTVPEDYRPKLSVATIGIQGSTGVCSAWVQNTGDVWIRPHSAASANTTFEFMLIYNKAATWGIQQEVIDDD